MMRDPVQDQALLSQIAVSSRLRGARRLGTSVLRVPWVTLGVLALVAATGFANGGYFPSSWGWSTLAAGWAAALALVAGGRGALGRAGGVAAGGLAGFSVWTALSVAWSDNPTATVLAAERTSVYLAAFLAALLWARDRPERLLHGAWAAGVVLAGWALLTRLVPDRWGVTDPISGYRLSEPIGYWNSLGLLAALAALLGLGLAARGSSLPLRAAGAASVPILTGTLYFTFSRGAWLVLAVGLGTMVLVGPGRLQLMAVLVAITPAAALVVWRAAVSSALTTAGSPMPVMAAQGHRLLPIVVAAATLAALATLAVTRAERFVRVPARVKRALAYGVLAVTLAAVVAGLGAISPVGSVEHVWHEFATGTPSGSGTLNTRLFAVGGNGRVTLWRVAWRDVEAHPLLGSGAGTYQEAWFRQRPLAISVHNAHNLYLETLAELGPLGLALLLVFLLPPLLVVGRVRNRPLTVAAVGAYVAFLVHLIVDWDWQITSVALVGVFCAAFLLSGDDRPLRPRVRNALLGGAVLIAAAGIYTIASQLPLSRLSVAIDHGNWAGAEHDAREASALAPWSEQPWLELGEAELNAGRLASARPTLHKAVADAPGDWAAWADLVRATSGHARAKALARLLKLNPLDQEAR
jgi:hypothetical protein